VGGEQASYLFTLMRQPIGAPFAGCWMTDGVVRLPDTERPAAVRRSAAAE